MRVIYSKWRASLVTDFVLLAPPGRCCLLMRDFIARRRPQQSLFEYGARNVRFTAPLPLAPTYNISILLLYIKWD